MKVALGGTLRTKKSREICNTVLVPLLEGGYYLHSRLSLSPLYKSVLKSSYSTSKVKTWNVAGEKGIETFICHRNHMMPRKRGVPSVIRRFGQQEQGGGKLAKEMRPRAFPVLHKLYGTCTKQRPLSLFFHVSSRKRTAKYR